MGLDNIDLWKPFADSHLVENQWRRDLFKTFQLSLRQKYGKSTIKGILKAYKSTRRNNTFFEIRSKALSFFKRRKLAHIGLVLK